MEIELLTNPLDKGESWENKSKRQITITESGDNRGMKPNVYFGINKFAKKTKHSNGIEIIEDFFLDTSMAIKIGKAIIKQAKKTDSD